MTINDDTNDSSDIVSNNNQQHPIQHFTNNNGMRVQFSPSSSHGIPPPVRIMRNGNNINVNGVHGTQQHSIQPQQQHLHHHQLPSSRRSMNVLGNGNGSNNGNSRTTSGRIINVQIGTIINNDDEGTSISTSGGLNNASINVERNETEETGVYVVLPQEEQQQQQHNDVNNLSQSRNEQTSSPTTLSSTISTGQNSTTTNRTSSRTTNHLRRVLAYIPPPQPFPQVNITINELKEQPFLPTTSHTQQQEERHHISSQNNLDDINNNNNIVSSFPSEYECTICCEVMTNPIACGSCDGRFCKSCLYKTSTQQQQQQQQDANLNDIIPCPYCRKHNTMSNYQQDIQLKQKIQNSTLCKPCIYLSFGCHVLCKPCTIGLHEATCLYKPYKCKYSCYGCTFQGTKFDLKLHYESGLKNHYYQSKCTPSSQTSTTKNKKNDIEPCFFIKLESIYKQQKIQQLQYQHLHPILQTKFIQERSILIQTTHQLLALQSKHHTNIFHLFQCIYECTCKPHMFIWQSILWKSFWNCENTRCEVNNVVVLIGLVGWVFGKIGWMGLRLIWDVVGKWDEVQQQQGHSSKNGDNEGEYAEEGVQFCSENDGQCFIVKGGTKLFHSIDDDDEMMVVPIVILCICTVLLCSLFLFCFQIDRGTKQWMKIPIKVKYRFIQIESRPLPIIQCIQILLSIFIHFLCIDMENSYLRARYNIKGMIKLACLLFASTCFPQIVDAMLLLTSNLYRQQLNERLKNDLVFGKALPLVQVGIKYAVLLYYFDMVDVVLNVWLFDLLFNQIICPSSKSSDCVMQLISEVFKKDEIGAGDQSSRNSVIFSKGFVSGVAIHAVYCTYVIQSGEITIVDYLLQVVTVQSVLLIETCVILGMEKVGTIVGNLFIQTMSKAPSENTNGNVKLVIGQCFYFLWICTICVIILL